MTAAADLPPRLAAIKALRPGILIMAPEAGLSSQWRASWLTSVAKGGAEEAKHDDADCLADVLEERFRLTTLRAAGRPDLEVPEPFRVPVQRRPRVGREVVEVLPQLPEFRCVLPGRVGVAVDRPR